MRPYDRREFDISNNVQDTIIYVRTFITDSSERIRQFSHIDSEKVGPRQRYAIRKVFPVLRECSSRDGSRTIGRKHVRLSRFVRDREAGVDCTHVKEDLATAVLASRKVR
jgi:hypothetical protein